MKQNFLLAVAITSMLAGCSGQKPESCWSKETKSTVPSLVKNVTVEHIGTITKNNGTPLTDEIKKLIADRTKVETTGLYAVSSVPDVGRITCGATVHLNYDIPNAKPITGETDIEFDIYKGEGGLIYSIPKGPIGVMVDTANEEK